MALIGLIRRQLQKMSGPILDPTLPIRNRMGFVSGVWIQTTIVLQLRIKKYPILYGTEANGVIQNF